jgi:DNA invertase Pin-like site-specific DNA recombinase
MIQHTKTVQGYVRGSTIDQQNTLAAQRKQIEDYCSYKGLRLAGVTIDEGESAFEVAFFERPQVSAMLAQIQATGATGIVITKLDRGFRNALDCLFTLENLKNRGIDLHLLDLGLEPDTPVGKLLLTMLAGIAEFENKRRSERQLAAFAVMRAARHRSGTIPYGWDAVPSRQGRVSKTGRPAEDLVPNEFEQSILQFILAASEGGSTDRQIAAHLVVTAVPTKNAGKRMRRAGREFIVRSNWTAAQVRSVRLNALCALCPAPSNP